MRETVSLFRNGDKMCITKAQGGLKVGDTRNIKVGILNGSQKNRPPCISILSYTIKLSITIFIFLQFLPVSSRF